MSCAQRLKRVFNIEITQYEVCEKFNAKIIACITDAIIINKILSHMDRQSLWVASNDSSAPPRIGAFSDYTIHRDFDFGALITETYHHLNIQNVEARGLTYLILDFSTKDQFNYLFC